MDLLQVRNGRIVDARGNAVRLRGTCVGGWMNMENFIDGYPGSEHGVRAAVAEALGEDKARFFFDRLLDYFLAEEDIAFLRSLGVNLIRLPLNYRHFESDMAPYEYREEGFARLDRAVSWCARHGIYAILDLHSVQGWQNTDWHCDNGCRQVLFWRDRTYQDRFVALWRELARRYRGNAAVAGYNVMNEPVTNAPYGRFGRPYRTDWDVINAVYRRVVTAIREIDPDHLIFLEGDYFSNNFSGFEAPFAPNLVYSSHNYTAAGFGPGPYPGIINGTEWNRRKQEEVFETREGTKFAAEHRVPLWVGEFGSVYNGPAEEVPDRLRALDDQIAVFDEHDAHWTTWTYKDVGVMGWVTLDPESEYLQRLKDLTRRKADLGTDFWVGWLPAGRVGQKVEALAAEIAEIIGDPEAVTPESTVYLKQAVQDNFVGGLLQPLYAKAFQGLSEEGLDRVLQSFALRHCRVNEGLAGVIRKHLCR